MNDCKKLASAVMGGDTTTVDQMLTNNPELRLHARDISGWPLMHLAATHGHVSMLRVLRRHNIDIDISYEYDITPIELAVYHNQFDVVRELIVLGAEVDESCVRKIFYDTALKTFGTRLTMLSWAKKENMKEVATCITTMFSKTAHRNLFGISIAMAALNLPAYVLMWIVDWLPEFTLKPEIKKINLIQRVFTAVRMLRKHN